MNLQMPQMKHLWILLSVWIALPVSAQKSYYSRLEKDTLTIGNSLIERKFIWNQGNLITYSLTDKTSGHCWINRSPPQTSRSPETSAT